MYRSAVCTRAICVSFVPSVSYPALTLSRVLVRHDRLRKARKWDTALQLLGQLRGATDGPDSFSYRAVIET